MHQSIVSPFFFSATSEGFPHSWHTYHFRWVTYICKWLTFNDSKRSKLYQYVYQIFLVLHHDVNVLISAASLVKVVHASDSVYDADVIEPLYLILKIKVSLRFLPSHLATGSMRA
jgi:hypothetical protein